MSNKNVIGIRGVICVVSMFLIFTVTGCAQEKSVNQLPSESEDSKTWQLGNGMVIWGSSAAPFPGETGIDRIGAWSRLNDKIKLLNGGYGLLARRSYDREIPGSFEESAMAPDVNLCPVSVGSFKPSWRETAEGTNHAEMRKFIQSIPDDHTVYLVFHHEPENEALMRNDRYSPELLQEAFAQFVDVVLSAGKPNVHPCFVLMSWTFNSKSGRNPDDFNMAVNLKSGQIDKVVAGLDGYADVPSKGSAEQTFDANLKRLESWGFSRFGIFETATHPVDTEPGREEWINELGNWANGRKNIELVSWFHSAVGQHAGEKGWYLGEWTMDNEGNYQWKDDGSLKAYSKLLIP